MSTIEQLRNKFSSIDAEGTGEITSNELHLFYKNNAEEITKEIVDDMIKRADSDGNGTINFEEFCAMNKMELEREIPVSPSKSNSMLFALKRKLQEKVDAKK